MHAAERREAREEHAHRVGVVREGVDGLLDPLRDGVVENDRRLEVRELLRGGEAAVDDEVGRLEVRGGLGELLDGVAAVAEDALGGRLGGRQVRPRRDVGVAEAWRRRRRAERPVVNGLSVGLVAARLGRLSLVHARD